MKASFFEKAVFAVTVLALATTVAMGLTRQADGKVIVCGLEPEPAMTDERWENLQPSKFDIMLRGYCLAGSKVEDKQALGGFYASPNVPRSLPGNVPDKETGVHLIARPNDHAVFQEKYRGMTVWLVNQTGKRVSFSASDSRLSMVQEAQDENGEWKSIEYLPSSWCGNSYHTVFLDPGEYWSFAAPKYEGSMKTKLRFSMTHGSRVIHSNSFEGSVNPEQFTNKEGHTPTNIMDPYDE